MNYRVLWIDDDCNTSYGREFIGQAEQDNVDITAFESHEEGILFLASNMINIHAVILDAKVKHKKNDTVTGLEGLRASRDRLIEINKNNYLPYFIFTGQPDYHANQMFKESFGEYYIKGVDNVRLITDLIEKVEKKEEYILQKKYKDVFEVCTDEYIGESCKKPLMQILKSINTVGEEFDDEIYFTQIRIVLEWFFRASNKIGLLHDACLPDGKVNLIESSTFLAGVDTKYFNVKCSVAHLPKIIANNVKSIIDITGAASHTTEADTKNNINLSNYRKCIRTSYLLYSLTYQLMDILIWYKQYLKNNSDIKYNKSLWQNIDNNSNDGEWIKGELAEINDKGWGKFLSMDGTWSIPPQMIKQSGFREGEELEITTKTENKTHIDKIRKI